MADEKANYPQVPSTVWWGVRGILQSKPSVTIDAKLLAVSLGVQDAAATAYVKQLQNLKIIDTDGKATPIALKWRLDAEYPDAVAELLKLNYPDSLRDHLAPAAENREKIVQWFMYDGLGKGAAGNKAATYLLIGTENPNGSDQTSKSKQLKAKPSATSSKTPTKIKESEKKDEIQQGDAAGNLLSQSIPLNLNMQIHISAEATNEQIEQVFKAMRKYLYGIPD